MNRKDRLARKLGHSKQERVNISEGVPAARDLREGVPVIKSLKNGLFEYVKHNGVLYKKELNRV